ncbi:MAG TPA: hypothetical protein VKT74_07770 [Gammaproteobacteria bacterium]|nr:hypothetical protein [Gammaproteobacteria bacterium]
MQVSYLDSLDRAVAVLLKQAPIRESIARLKGELQTSPEPFVWATLDCQPLAGILPPQILSAWIFVLRRDVWSGAHFHPNSIQHMVVVEGRGRSKIAGEESLMLPYGTPGHPPEAAWQVIEKKVTHEFLPEAADMVVISFHTCAPDELLEIESGTGHARVYEVRN